MDQQVQTLDLNGDGALDIVGYDLPTSALRDHEPDSADMAIYINRRARPERIIAVTNGLQRRDEIDYMPMSNPDVYTPARECEWPQRCDVGTRHLVREVRFDSGRSKPLTYTYRYYDGRTDMQGRGFLGFALRTETEEHTGHVTATHFHNASAGGEHAHWSKGRPTKIVRFIETDDAQLPGQTSSRLIASQSIFGYARAFDAASGRYVVNTTLRKSMRYEAPNPIGLEPETADIQFLVTIGDLPQTIERLEYPTSGALHERALPTRRQVTQLPSGSTATRDLTYVGPGAHWWIGRPETVVATSSDGPGCAGVTAVRNTYGDYGTLETRVSQPHDLVPPRPVEDQEDEWLKVAYEYEPEGNLVRVVASDMLDRVRETRVAYDATHTYPAATYNALDHKTSLFFEPKLGAQFASVSPNEEQTGVQYDGFGRARVTIGTDGVRTTLDYQAPSEGGLRVEQRVEGDAYSEQTFDRAGNVVRVGEMGRRGITPTRVYVDYERNDANAMARVSEPYFEGRSPRRWHTFDYDGAQVLRRVRGLAAGSERTMWRSQLQRFSRDSRGAVTQVDLDEQYRISVASQADGGTTTHAYCLDGRVQSVADAHENVTRIEYDALGRRLSLDDPDAGMTTYRHDVFGGVREMVDARGWTTTTAYDVLGRPVRRTDMDGDTTWAYDEGEHGLGRLSWEQSADGIYELYVYNALGQLEGQKRLVDGARYDYGYAYAYDAAGRIASVAYPDPANDGRFIVEYEYDEYGQITAALDASSGDTLWKPLSFDAYGNMKKERFGDGTTTIRRFEAGTTRATSIDTRVGGASVQTLEYEYDAEGNLVARNDLLHDESETFEHDALGRLERWTSSVDGVHTQKYDQLGNIMRSSDGGVYEYGGAPHQVTSQGGATLRYDDVGNVIRHGARRITWTATNMARRITDGSDWLEIRYDASGARAVTQSPKGTRVYYLDYERRGESDVFGVRVGERVVAQVTRKDGREVVDYLHDDHLGSVDTITRRGEVVARNSYGAFGERRSRAWTAESETVDHGYTGHEHDEELGLINMGARLYDPRLRRTLSADPMINGAYRSGGYNRYSYVLNNPLRFTDPTGLLCDDKFTGRCEEVTFDDDEVVNGEVRSNESAEQLGAPSEGSTAGSDETNPAATDVTPEASQPSPLVPTPDDLVHPVADYFASALERDLSATPDALRNTPAGLLAQGYADSLRGFATASDPSQSQGDRALGALQAASGAIAPAATRGLGNLGRRLVNTIRQSGGPVAATLRTATENARRLLGRLRPAHSNCFAAGTLVAVLGVAATGATAEASAPMLIPIENVRVGDRVLTARMEGTETDTSVTPDWIEITLEMTRAEWR